MKKLALVGNPNVGKSVIFGCLTGKYVTVSNYPGTTVEVSRGHAKIGETQFDVIDTPGLYSIYPITEEERVTLDLINDERPDIIIHVIDTKNLERSLPLTFQLKEMGLNIIVVLNMFDEAMALEMTINTSALSEEIGIPVIATVATTKQGINQLIENIKEASLKTSATTHSTQDLIQFSEPKMRVWHKMACDIASGVIKRIAKKRSLSKLDGVLVSPLTGLPILAAVLYFGLYKFVGGFGAGVLVDFLESGFKNYLNPWFLSLSDQYIPWPIVRELFTGEYGIITLGVRYAVAIILPIVGLFFLVFAIIEDSGYLPRLALLLDRAFKRIGLSGRAIIPMVLGLGCDTMATMVTRTLPTKRERFIATLLLALCIPCSAQIGVILGLLSNAPYVLLTWILIMTGIFALVGFVMSVLVPGAKPSFVMEIPPMRVPKIKNVLTKTYTRMEWYFKEIVPLFIVASIMIWLLQVTHIFDYIVRAMETPLLAMGLPTQTSTAFIFGFFRRDYGAAGLYDIYRSGGFTNNQLLIAVTVLTLFLPCITQFLITIKERGWKVGVGISVFVFGFAITTGILLHKTLNFFSINF